jgi:2-octaprenyl-3-methyl-6-methoxy-1,4-benzoquinol hydroxylase/2-octaprenylphenol hydroxylase
VSSFAELPRRRANLLDAIVVGAGMVGAAAALALAREGFSVALVESRAPATWRAEDEVDLRVVGLASSSIDLLQHLGVWTSIRDARASSYARMHVWDAGSGAAIDFTADAIGRTSLGAIVENALVQDRLWQAIVPAGVRLLCPATVSAFQADDDRVQVELDDGTTLAARLLVAADGSDSPLRRMAGIDAARRDYDQRAIVAHVSHERGHEHTAWQRFLPGGPLALLPLADGRSSVVWSLPDAGAAQLLALDDHAFMNALGSASDFRLGRIVGTTARASFPLRLQLAGRYEARRFVLLGDAAHTVHPLAGQGVNLGLRDVAELRATMLAARSAGSDIGAPHVLRRYARRRRSDDTLDARSFDALARIYAWQWPPLVALRGLGIGLVERLSPLKRLLSSHAGG